MAIATGMTADFMSIVNTYGVPFSMQIYTGSPYNDYDEETPQASGGSVVGSLMAFPLGKHDLQYLEQGVDSLRVKKIFFSGAAVDETAVFKFNAGSWTFTKDGLFPYQVEGQTIYYKAFVIEI